MDLDRGGCFQALALRSECVMEHMLLLMGAYRARGKLRRH